MEVHIYKVPPISPDKGPYGLFGIKGCSQINIAMYSKWLVSMANTQELGCLKISTIFAISFYYHVT